jgi:fluoroacetyl-CoA thioesterase
MDLEKVIRKGSVHEESFQVVEEHSAIQVGSGGAPVLATPWLIAYLERVAYRMLAEVLPAGTSSVGVLVDVRHLAPTPVNGAVRVRAEINELQGSKVVFKVLAWDQVEKIGEGIHQRVVIDEARFLKRVEGKNKP